MNIIRGLVYAAVMAFLLAFTASVLVLYFTRGEATSPDRRTTRVHYIAAEEIDWNYLPATTELSAQNEEYGEKYLSRQSVPLRIGSIYRKAVFREYTDETYSELQQREEWLGVLGPLLFGETGDVLEIHLRNNLTRPVSLHSHGVRYEKRHEGAHYQDDSQNESDGKIRPNDTYTYIWEIPADRGPTLSDSECMIWAYHSHVFGDTDIHTGLIGPLIICQNGHISRNGNTSQLSPKEFAVLFLIFDENQSWYLHDNIALAAKNMTLEEMEELMEDESFRESNLMHSVNGYMYDTLQGLEVCQGSNITWYAIGMGNEADIHAVTFEGHTLTVNGHRTDVIHLFPGKFVTGCMEANHDGHWAIKSEVGHHFLDGMEASFVVKKCSDQPTATPEEAINRTRKYFIAAEEQLWNYAPSGLNVISNSTLLDDSDAAIFFEDLPNRIGGTYKKALYVEYTSENFEVRKERQDSLGILGPTIRAEVGDLLQITFYNNATRPYSFHSTPLICRHCNFEGSRNRTIPVFPRTSHTYEYVITENLGPTSTDLSCIAWRYFSNVNSIKDIYSGLIGTLLICRPGYLTDNWMQKNVDKEFPLMFGVVDENESHYIEDNIEMFIDSGVELNREDPDFIESNKMHSINGLMYGNVNGLNLCTQDKVSWLLTAIGDEVDLHVAHFWGNAVLHWGRFTDTIQLLPGSHVAVEMVPDAKGAWLLQCQTNDHHIGGMSARYHVEDCKDSVKDSLLSDENKSTELKKSVREYFLAIVEKEWDYAPINIHAVTGENLTENKDSAVFVTQDETHIGSRYMKALFREYTDSSFKFEKSRTKQQEHLGFLGPTIKAEVGETIRITLFNNGSNPHNIRPHGVFESAGGEGEAIDPGMLRIYEWDVPPRSGPPNLGFNCTNWMYYSTHDIVKDSNSGLVGPLVICRPGILDSRGVRKDLDKEFSLLLTVTDENESWYLNRNIQKYCFEPEHVDLENEDFKESNLKHSINGRLYGTLQGLDGRVGERVAWYLMGLGNEIDLHTLHFHGLTAIEESDATEKYGNRKDVIDLSPGIFRTVEMILDSPGKWMLHCHVDDHLKAGMLAMISVER